MQPPLLWEARGEGWVIFGQGSFREQTRGREVRELSLAGSGARMVMRVIAIEKGKGDGNNGPSTGLRAGKHGTYELRTKIGTDAEHSCRIKMERKHLTERFFYRERRQWLVSSGGEIVLWQFIGIEFGGMKERAGVARVGLALSLESWDMGLYADPDLGGVEITL